MTEQLAVDKEVDVKNIMYRHINQQKYRQAPLFTLDSPSHALVEDT